MLTTVRASSRLSPVFSATTPDTVSTSAEAQPDLRHRTNSCLRSGAVRPSMHLQVRTEDLRMGAAEYTDFLRTHPESQVRRSVGLGQTPSAPEGNLDWLVAGV